MIKIWKLTIVETKEHLKTDDELEYKVESLAQEDGELVYKVASLNHEVEPLVHEVYFDNHETLEKYLDRLRETRKSMVGIGCSLMDIYYMIEELPMIQASTENVYNKRNRVKVECPVDCEEILDRFEKLEA